MWDQLLHYLNFVPRHVSGYLDCGFAYNPPYSLGPVLPITGLAYPPVSSHPSNGCWWHRILNRFSIAYALRLGLGPGLPWADEPSPGNLRFSAGRILTCLLAYSYRHSLFCTLHHSLRYSFAAYRTLPYHCTYVQSVASVPGLAPLHFRRRATRPVSYYALFKWWLLLSQHPGCLCNPTSFST